MSATKTIISPDVRNINTPLLGSYYQTAVATGALSASAISQPYNQYPGYANIPLLEDATNSHYESLQVALILREWHGLTVNLGLYVFESDRLHVPGPRRQHPIRLTAPTITV